MHLNIPLIFLLAQILMSWWFFIAALVRCWLLHLADRSFGVLVLKTFTTGHFMCTFRNFFLTLLLLQNLLKFGISFFGCVWSSFCLNEGIIFVVSLHALRLLLAILLFFLLLGGHLLLACKIRFKPSFGWFVGFFLLFWLLNRDRIILRALQTLNLLSAILLSHVSILHLLGVYALNESRL